MIAFEKIVSTVIFSALAGAFLAAIWVFVL
jgi:hypothetical protein